MSAPIDMLMALEQSLIVERGFRPLERSLPQSAAVATGMLDACLARQEAQDLHVHALLVDHGHSLEGLRGRHRDLREALKNLEGSVPGRVIATLWILAPDRGSAAQAREALAQADPGHFLSKTLLGAAVINLDDASVQLVKGTASDPSAAWFESVIKRGQGPGQALAESAILRAEAEERLVRDLVGGAKPWGTWILVGICCVVFVGQVMVARALSDALTQADPKLLDAWSRAYSLTLQRLGANSHELVIVQGQTWRLLASIFLHADLLHILMNMMGLLSLGALLERLCGGARLMALFLVTGLCGSLLSALMSTGGLALGASGAILGLAGVLMAPKLRRPKGMPKAMADRLFDSLARPIAILFGLGLLLSLIGTPLQLDNWSHLGGLVSGFVIAWVFPGLFKHRQA